MERQENEDERFADRSEDNLDIPGEQRTQEEQGKKAPTTSRKQRDSGQEAATQGRRQLVQPVAVERSRELVQPVPSIVDRLRLGTFFQQLAFGHAVAPGEMLPMNPSSIALARQYVQLNHPEAMEEFDEFTQQHQVRPNEDRPDEADGPAPMRNRRNGNADRRLNNDDMYYEEMNRRMDKKHPEAKKNNGRQQYSDVRSTRNNRIESASTERGNSVSAEVAAEDREDERVEQIYRTAPELQRPVVQKETLFEILVKEYARAKDEEERRRKRRDLDFLLNKEEERLQKMKERVLEVEKEQSERDDPRIEGMDPYNLRNERMVDERRSFRSESRSGRHNRRTLNDFDDWENDEETSFQDRSMDYSNEHAMHEMRNDDTGSPLVQDEDAFERNTTRTEQFFNGSGYREFAESPAMDSDFQLQPEEEEQGEYDYGSAEFEDFEEPGIHLLDEMVANYLHYLREHGHINEDGVPRSNETMEFITNLNTIRNGYQNGQSFEAIKEIFDDFFNEWNRDRIRARNEAWLTPSAARKYAGKRLEQFQRMQLDDPQIIIECVGLPYRVRNENLPYEQMEEDRRDSFRMENDAPSVEDKEVFAPADDSDANELNDDEFEVTGPEQRENATRHRESPVESDSEVDEDELEEFEDDGHSEESEEEPDEIVKKPSKTPAVKGKRPCSASHYNNSRYRPAVCPFGRRCGTFQSEKQLERHMRDVHPGRGAYSCSTCKREFNQRSDLRVHQRVHDGGQPYKCELCSKSFAYRSGLRDHIRVTHENQKNYKCAICKGRFSRKSTLTKHMIVHRRPTPFKCSFKGCGESWHTAKALDIHERRHTSKFPCNLCSHVPLTKEHLKKHMRDKH